MKSPRHSRAVEFRAGVHLQGSVLWCDAVHARECCFVSSARLASAAARRHRQVITSAATAALLGRRDTGVLPAPLGRPFHLGRLRLEPFASGAALGAASLLVEDAGRRLVYAGAIAARPALTAAAADQRRADVLVVHAEHAPTLALPPAAATLDALASWLTGELAAGATPVVMAGLHGDLEELAAQLGARGLGLCAHPQVAASLRGYRTLGARVPVVRGLRAARGGDVLLWPLGTPLVSAAGGPLPGVARRALVTGRPAGDLGVPHDASFAWSSLADGVETAAYVAASAAHELYFTGPAAEAFAAAQRRAGADAHALGPPRQMELFASANSGSPEADGPGAPRTMARIEVA